MAAEAAKAAAVRGLTHKSSVCLIPPAGLWGPIQDIRRVHDRNYVRWMPHVNLLYPFIPDSQYEDAVAVLRSVLCGLKPFTVTLSSFQHFNHGKSNTMWLLPETERNVVREAEKMGASWSPITYEVDHVCLISRSGFDDPFHVRYRVYFDGRLEKEP